MLHQKNCGILTKDATLHSLFTKNQSLLGKGNHENFGIMEEAIPKA